MKRIVGTVVALAAVLGFSTASQAAIINFDVSGTGSLTTISSLGVFVSPFAAGSSVSVNTDTNGDSIEGDVSLVSGTLNVIGTTDLTSLGLGSIDSNVVNTLSGGTGSLSGEDILWSNDADVSVVASGTVTCHGAICSFFQDGMGGTWVDGVAYPYALWQANQVGAGNTYINPTALGTWDVVAGTIVGSSQEWITVQTSNPAQPTSYFLFGATDLGAPVNTPEPGVFALMLLGLGGLALRSRKA